MRSKARRARSSGRDSSASQRSAGRHWFQWSCDHFGAPALEQARAAAEQEVAFAASLCDHPLDTLLALHRTHQDGEIREQFRVLRPRGGPKPLRAFSFLEVEEEAEPGETIDLMQLAEGEHK